MKILVIPNGFEANYTLGFLRGLLAGKVTPLVVSYQEIIPGLEKMGVAHFNIHGSQRPDRSPAKKIWTLLCYYHLLTIAVWRHRHLPVHFSGVFNRRRVISDGLLFAFLGKCFSRRFYYTVHNVLPHHQENNRWLRLWYRWLYKAPDRLVVHTDGAARQLTQEFAVPAHKLIKISIGLNEEVPHPEVSRSAARKLLKLETSARWFLFFGKTEPYKGLDLLLAAWRRAQVPQARLAIVGLCENPDYREIITAALRDLPQPEAVAWHEGHVSNEELGLWLTAADYGVLPYRNIYQSGVVFLYLQHGLPILASDVGSLHDYIGPEEGRLLPKEDEAAWTLALEQAAGADYPFDRPAIQASARKYGWDRVCDRLLADYATVHAVRS